MKIYVLSPLKYRSFWVETLSFWGLSCIFLEKGELPPTKATLLADNSEDTLRKSFDFLGEFIENGGNALLIGGIPTVKDALLGGLFSTYTDRGSYCRAPEVETPFDGFLPSDALLFCLDSSEKKRHELSGNIPADATVFARTLTLHRDPSCGKLSLCGRETAPSIIGRKIGAGNLLYLPYTTFSLQSVLQPIVPFSPNNYFTVKNHGAVRLVKGLLATVNPALSFRSIYPHGAASAISITGDVHDYVGIPGREDREWKDMIYNIDIMRDLGLEGKAAFYLSAVVGKKHPVEISKALDRGYELQPHTYIETQYEVEKWDYARQLEDLTLCQTTLTSVYGKEGTFLYGHRTHGYQSNYITREALCTLGNVEYISDLQAWEVPDMLPAELQDTAILYFGLPQKCYGINTRILPLVELPDTVANDHFCYRVYKFTPEQALAFWTSRFDRIYRLGGYWQTCLHPYISIQEAPGREETYKSLLRHMQSKSGVEFINPLELVRFYNQQDGLII